jgi:hypothetical protein
MKEIEAAVRQKEAGAGPLPNPELTKLEIKSRSEGFQIRVNKLP